MTAQCRCGRYDLEKGNKPRAKKIFLCTEGPIPMWTSELSNIPSRHCQSNYNVAYQHLQKASEVSRIIDINPEFDECPSSGAYDADKKLYIGKYPYQKWKDDSVRPNWNRICSAREQQGIGKENGRYHGKKKEHSELESQISQLIKKKACMEASIASIVTDGTATEVSTLSRAGDSFGGRSEKE